MAKLTAAQQRLLDDAIFIAASRLVFSKLAQSHTPITKLSTIAETTSGGTPLRSVSAYYGGNIPWIKSGDLNDGLIEGADEYITTEGLQNSSAKIFPAGTVVIALYGATVGKTGILNIDAASNQAVCAIFPKNSDIDRNYLFWFLRHKRQDFLDMSFGGAQPNISQAILRETQIPVPPYDLQQQISQFLKIITERQAGYPTKLPNLPEPLSQIPRIVAQIEVLAARIEEARGLRRGAVEEAEALVVAKKNYLFSADFIAKYPSYSLGTVSEIQSGVTLGRDLTGERVSLPYLRVANVQDGFLDLGEIKEVEIRASEFEKWQLEIGDILLTEGGDWDKLGRGAVWKGEIKNCIHQNHIFRLRVNPEKFDPYYLMALISSPYGKAYFQNASKQTTNLASINQRQLKAFQIYGPPLPDQHRIVAYLDSLQAQVDHLKRLQAETAAELDALLPSVLDKAFKGEL